MESLPWERRAGRLVHFDVIYPEHASRGRPLKGGVTEEGLFQFTIDLTMIGLGHVD
jgi:hypothetical protein